MRTLRKKPAPDFRIEPVQDGDLVAVMRLAWRTTHHLYPAPFFAAIARHQREYFRVVRHASDERVVAFIIAAKQPGLETNFLLLAVEPAHEGQGMRRALLKSVQETLRTEGHRNFTVEWPINDQETIAFYRRQGFGIVGVERGPTISAPDTVVLSKPLA